MSYPDAIIEHMFGTEATETMEAAIGDLIARDVQRLPDEDIERRVIVLQRVIDRLQAERLRLVAEAERRKTFKRDGFVSATTWLADRNRTSFGAAKRDVVMARALGQMPVTRRALERGEVSAAAVGVLVKARETVSEQFESNEESLVDAARCLPVGALRSRVTEWGQRVDAEGAEQGAERQYERRRLGVYPSVNGMVRMDGELDPESGCTIITALGALVDGDVRRGADLRTPAQRRADAMAEICRGWLASKDRSGVAGERPHVTVTVDIEALGGRGGGRCELPDVGPIPPETARRIACDASISRVITKGPSEPLEVGRRTNVVSPGLRRAVAIRDGGCRFPGCDRPQSWCDAHHVVHWADGGETSLQNLVLLCRPHHRSVHQGFRIRMTAAGPEFRRPDGTLLEDRAPIRMIGSARRRPNEASRKAANSAGPG